MVEALVVSGVGFLFVGLAALTAGCALTALPDITTLQQWMVFFVSGAIWALLLWKPLQKFRGKGAKNTYQNMVGDIAYIGASGLKKGDIGEATWSGTIMKARLADDATTEHLAGGSQVVISSVTGNTLAVKPSK
jgi:membrane protein implicated in regulation of membrane protease activity